MKRFTYVFPAGSYRLSDGETEHSEPAVAVVPGLLVTGAKGHYRVTHGASGAAVSDYISKFSEAVAIAMEMGKLFDWRVSEADIHAVMQSRGADFRKRLRAVSRGEPDPLAGVDTSYVEMAGARD